MSEPVVETHELMVRYGGLLAVDHVNFMLRERELRCLIGPNGAGKSTFFKSVTGQIRAATTSGRVLIRGHDVTDWPTHRIVRLGIGIKTSGSLGDERAYRCGKSLAFRPTHGGA